MTVAGYILIGALLGWFGHGQLPKDPSPLVESNCVEISPPIDKTFGATTDALLQCVQTYKKCRTACQ